MTNTRECVNPLEQMSLLYGVWDQCGDEERVGLIMNVLRGTWKP
jgi:hypothetical protein